MRRQPLRQDSVTARVPPGRDTVEPSSAVAPVARAIPESHDEALLKQWQAGWLDDRFGNDSRLGGGPMVTR